MSALICPTILAGDPHAYREQMSKVADFASRVQIDLTDGEFTKSRTVDPANIYWPEHILADIHLMFRSPKEAALQVAELQPHLIIVHTEAEGDIISLMREIRSRGVKAGVALLQETQPEDKADMIHEADHVLIFSGSLGNFGGTADLSLTSKIRRIKTINPDAEIGWDGGVNSGNVGDLAIAGVNVLNVGGAIQRELDAKFAYEELSKTLPKELEV